MEMRQFSQTLVAHYQLLCILAVALLETKFFSILTFTTYFQS